MSLMDQIMAASMAGVCLPMVELETVLGTGAPLSTADNEALTKASESAMPVIIKGALRNGGEHMPLCVVLNYMGGGYGATLAGMNAQFMPSASGQWAFSMS